jgi:NAD(P)-dependent dehydrogenase (short-subunit alcohol dehydrogenase family)
LNNMRTKGNSGRRDHNLLLATICILLALLSGSYAAGVARGLKITALQGATWRILASLTAVGLLTACALLFKIESRSFAVRVAYFGLVVTVGVASFASYPVEHGVKELPPAATKAAVPAVIDSPPPTPMDATPPLLRTSPELGPIAAPTAHASPEQVVTANPPASPDQVVTANPPASPEQGATANAAYAASKGAVISLTWMAAQQLGRHNINVNAICPGVTRTELGARNAVERAAERGITVAELNAEAEARIPIGRANQPEDIAAMAVFLASPAARNITGQAYNVDGGLVPS